VLALVVGGAVGVASGIAYLTLVGERITALDLAAD
jgi:hypothetical protein